MDGDVDGELAALKRATTLNPNHALIANLAATVNLFAGHLEEADRHLSHVRRLSPDDPAAFLFLTALGCVRLLRGDADAALALCTESAAVNPDSDFTYWVLGSAAGHARSERRAMEAFAQLTRLDPGTPLALPRLLVFQNAERRTRLVAGLRRAGLAR